MEGGFLLVENYSLKRLLSKVYPKFEWSSSRSADVHWDTSIWEDEIIAKHFVDWLKKYPESLKFLQTMIEKLRVKGGHLLELLTTTFPEYKWIANLHGAMKKSQYTLRECLKKLFPNDGNNHLFGN